VALAPREKVSRRIPLHFSAFEAFRRVHSPCAVVTLTWGGGTWGTGPQVVDGWSYAVVGEGGQHVGEGGQQIHRIAVPGKREQLRDAASTTEGTLRRKIRDVECDVTDLDVDC
jgi:hypothetical protein